MEDSTNGTKDDQHANQAKRTARIIEDGETEFAAFMSKPK
tara:strand:- start:7622 stop:7741 length:120 start_codon:yes stop_codon:yes gene_type:complete